ncbi:hypothetical protein PVAND_014096 [Polypedilum vanderplanki]|uniref:Cuticle protein n=1 Tax=Polypedilum vanderplanki TaxID=319348 RepID=A0A9J6CT53_POLVA|nr:hypothetical protein PVAND_014096 [Polypedilum vanderplanki]
MKLILFHIFICIILINAQQDSSENSNASSGLPMPYHYKYIIKDDEKELYIEKEESKDENDEVVKGFYSVLLPNGRIMRVEYVADKESGFVPKISYEDRNPFINEKDDVNEV